MDRRELWKALGRIAASLPGAGVFYLAWLAAFLLIPRIDRPAVGGVLWVSAPVVTAAGFATGIVLYDRLVRAPRLPFLRVLVWPLVGCAVGAGAVYWFGPMLIVFGMFAVGTAAVALREAVRLWQKR